MVAVKVGIRLAPASPTAAASSQPDPEVQRRVAVAAVAMVDYFGMRPLPRAAED